MHAFVRVLVTLMLLWWLRAGHRIFRGCRKSGLLWAFSNTEIMNVVAEAHMVTVMLVLLRFSHRRMRGCCIYHQGYPGPGLGIYEVLSLSSRQAGN